jgi:hypothetical protein
LNQDIRLGIERLKIQLLEIKSELKKGGENLNLGKRILPEELRMFIIKCGVASHRYNVTKWF